MQVVAFKGLPQSCAFVALSEGETQEAGLILTEIGPLADTRDRTHLAVWTKVFRFGDDFPAPREEMRDTQAVRDVAGFELSYFGAASPNGQPAWTESWLNRDRLPQLVSVKLAAERYGRRIETSYVVALPQE